MCSASGQVAVGRGHLRRRPNPRLGTRRLGFILMGTVA